MPPNRPLVRMSERRKHVDGAVILDVLQHERPARAAVG
jgi:hypothetical protein